MAGERLVGSTVPRVFTPPLRDLTEETSWGFDVIWFAREILREPLTQWQEWLSVHALELLPPELVRGMYPDHPELWDEEIPRFKTILVLVARQNGKTHWAKVLIKWALFRKRLPYVLGAAQTKNDAFELWEEITDECEDNPRVRARMKRTSKAHGFEALRSLWGSYRIAGLDRKAGRGKTVNLLYMDELREHRDWVGWSALSSTTNSPVVGFNVATSNAGDMRSVVLNSLQDSATESIVSGATDELTTFLAEWSADPELGIDDRSGWAQANPDLGFGRLTLRDLIAERESKEANDFRTENLCQRVETLEVGKIAPEEWRSLEDPMSRPVDGSVVHVAVDVSIDGEFGHVAVCGERADGLWHVEVVESNPGYTWIPHYLNSRRDAWFSGTVGVQPKGAPSAALVPLLEDAGIEIAEWVGSDMSGSVLGYFDAVRDGLIRYNGRDPSNPDEPVLLELSATGVKERRYGDTFIWSRDKSLFDATPFIATNIAWWMATRPAVFKSAYSADDFEESFEGGLSLSDGDDDALLTV